MPRYPQTALEATVTTTTPTPTREDLRDTAIHTLVTREKMMRAGMIDPAHRLDYGQPAIDAAHAAGWDSDDIYGPADRTYGQWLINRADRDEQHTEIPTVGAFIAAHRTLIGNILGRPIPADTSPAAFIQHIQDAARTLPDTPAWAYDRGCLELAADYLADAMQADDSEIPGLLRAADDAIAHTDITTWK